MKCSDCRHWDGVCRRYPPVAYPGVARVYPVTDPNDWCSEFSQKPIGASVIAGPMVVMKRKPGRPKKKVDEIKY